MKTCPVCRAVAFDDAEVCFGCMHRFEEGTAEPNPEPEPEPVASESAPPAFTIRFIPEAEPEGALKWNCVVEVA